MAAAAAGSGNFMLLLMLPPDQAHRFRPFRQSISNGDRFNENQLFFRIHIYHIIEETVVNNLCGAWFLWRNTMRLPINIMS